MKPLLTTAASFAIAVMTTNVIAGDYLQLGSSGFRVSMAPVDAGGVSAGTVAAADCNVRVGNRAVLLHWSTTPFSSVVAPDLMSDATLSATVTSLNGRVAASPHRAVDRTDLAGQDDTAAIAMGIEGNGRVRINFEVGIDSEHAAAGRHRATVFLTVTGN